MSTRAPRVCLGPKARCVGIHPGLPVCEVPPHANGPNSDRHREKHTVLGDSPGNGVGAELEPNLTEVEKGCYGEGRSLTDRQTGNLACRVREIWTVCLQAS